LRLDSNGDQEKYVEEKKKIKMKVRVDGLDLEAGSAEHLQAQASLDLKRDTKIAELEAAAAKQVAKIDSLTAELAAKDVTIAEHKTRQDALEASQKKIARAGLEKEASKILGDKFKYDGLSDDAVRIEAIKKVSPSFKTDHLDTKTLPIYLAARFDGELEKLARTDGSSARIAERLEGGDKEEREDSEYVLDEKNPDPEAARENMKRQLDSAWMPKEKKTNEKRAY
jgi:hypothetical protein